MAQAYPFSQTIADAFCEQIATSRKSMRTICAELGAVGITTILKWLDEHPDFAAQYARAREAQGHMLGDEVVSIADTANADNANAVRVKVDARKWAAGKLAPKVYGDRMAVEHSGSIDLNLNIRDMAVEDILAEIRDLMRMGFVPPDDTLSAVDDFEDLG